MNKLLITFGTILILATTAMAEPIGTVSIDNSRKITCGIEGSKMMNICNTGTQKECDDAIISTYSTMGEFCKVTNPDFWDETGIYYRIIKSKQK